MTNSELDPNAPTQLEQTLKRIEAAIRRRGDATLLIRFDGVCLETDDSVRKQELISLTQLLRGN